MKILVTGADGFIARNLIVRLGELPGFEVLRFARQTPEAALPGLVAEADAVVHLAGVNRPPSPDEFAAGNTGLTERLCEALAASGRTIPVIFSSSTQAVQENPYGRSKRAAEDALWRHAAADGGGGLCVSPAECLRQMVPAELQLGGGELLPQHHARAADPRR